MQSQLLNRLKIFFAVLKSLCSFITSSAVHPRFVEIQENIKRLKSWPDTRWSCRISAIKAVNETYPFILRTLDVIEQENHAERRWKASVLKHQIAQFEFILMLNVMLSIFGVTEILTECLQQKAMHVKASMDLIKASITSLGDLKSEDWFEDIYAKCLPIARDYGFEITLRSGKRR
jgi:hypothetical protein